MAQLVPPFAYKPLTCQHEGAEGCGVCGAIQADSAEVVGGCAGMHVAWPFSCGQRRR